MPGQCPHAMKLSEGIRGRQRPASGSRPRALPAGAPGLLSCLLPFWKHLGVSLDALAESLIPPSLSPHIQSRSQRAEPVAWPSFSPLSLWASVPICRLWGRTSR